MPLPRFQRLPPEKQAAILDAASSEFAEQGFSCASMNRIIEQAGFSKGVVYYYFDDKEDLYLTVLLRAQKKVYDHLGDFPAVEGRDEFWSAILDMIHRSMRFAVENQDLMGLQRSFITALARSELTRPLSEFQQPHFDFHRRFLKVGQEVGAIRKDLPDDLMLGILEGIDNAAEVWMSRHADDFSAAQWEEMMSNFLQIYRRVLDPGPGMGERS